MLRSGYGLRRTSVTTRYRLYSVGRNTPPVADLGRCTGGPDIALFFVFELAGADCRAAPHDAVVAAAPLVDAEVCAKHVVLWELRNHHSMIDTNQLFPFLMSGLGFGAVYAMSEVATVDSAVNFLQGNP